MAYIYIFFFIFGTALPFCWDHGSFVLGLYCVSVKSHKNVFYLTNSRLVLSFLVLKLVIYLFITRVSVLLISGCVCILKARLVTGALQGSSHSALLYMGNTFMIWNFHLWQKTWHQIWVLNASKWGNTVAIRSYGKAMSDSCGFQNNHIKVSGIWECLYPGPRYRREAVEMKGRNYLTFSIVISQNHTLLNWSS